MASPLSGLSRLAAIPLSLFIASTSAADSSPHAGVRRASAPPHEHHLQRGREFRGDLRTLPQIRPQLVERPEVEEPDPSPILLPGTEDSLSTQVQGPSILAERNAPAPAPLANFDGLDFATFGNGHPPDTNGDVGPTYFIQSINTSLGIYTKTGTRVAAFSFNTFMAQGAQGNLCDTNNFGDPVILYDTFEDRWVITDFAFRLDSGSNVVNPPGSFQCFAVSKTGDPVSGGWNFYSVNTTGGLGDYPKFGVWTDGIYMSANMFGYASGAAFQGPRVYALNKAQMYAGAPTVQVVSFDAPAGDFTLLPSNARLQTGTPAAGEPNFFVSTWQFLNALSVYKFHVDWANITLCTFTGPDTPGTGSSWPNANVANAPSQLGNALDVLQIRAMMQNQYSNLGGTESLWTSHTVRRATTTGAAAPRWYQVNVTGGTVAASTVQATTWDPDGNDVMNRFIPSVAVDRQGDMALGYTTSNSATKPALKYAGRLATDAANTFSQTEQVIIQGTGTQTGNCGSSACTRWGDYSSMTLDPDGCTFWYTAQYYSVDGLNHQTRIASFKFAECTPVGAGGTVSGTVTDVTTGSPLSGATVSLGSRTAVTGADGKYSFAVPAGTYPSLSAAASGYLASGALRASVTDSVTTTQDFALTPAPVSGCITDTTQADFQRGIPTACSLTTSPGDIALINAPVVDQSNATVGTSGVGITVTTYGGQTFTPAFTAPVPRISVNLFCSGCTGTTPALTLSIRATSGGLPTGADLASATIAGFGNGGVASDFLATFASPIMLTAGTQYALVIRPTANPSPGTYALTRSGTSTVGSDVYSRGTRVSGGTSGTVWSIPLTGGVSTDAGFKVYADNGYNSPGSFISGLKDANAAPNFAASWGTLSWNATTPGGTGVTFQVGSSNSPNGTFSFVGPDGTAATFFNSGDSLAQFNGTRYLRYKAVLSTSSGAVAPVLNDVTTCFADVPVLDTALAVPDVQATWGDASVNLSATLTANGAALGSRPVKFTLGGVNAGTNATSGTGAAGVTAVSLAGLNAGTYPIGASFIGDFSNRASTGAGTLTIAKAGQSISFATLPDKVATDAGFSLSASASSGLAVSFSSSSAACSVTSDGTVALIRDGDCTVAADQSGSVNYNAASTVPQTFHVALASQTLSFPAVTHFSWKGGSATLAATASSTLDVAFSVVSGPCQINGATLTATGAGSCDISAAQAGNTRYAAASPVTNTVAVDKAGQAITFAALSDKLATDADFTLAAASDSGLAVRYSTSSAACTVTPSGTVSLVRDGACALSADQDGNADYTAATTQSQSFTVALAPQSITFPAVSSFRWKGGSATLAASASSSLAVTYSVESGPCQVSGSTLTATGAGTCSVAADRAGTLRYSAASTVRASVTVDKAVQAITFAALADKIATDAGFTVPASSDSGLAVRFSSASTACTVAADGSVTLLTAGTCAIDADQAGSADYDAAAKKSRSFNISLASQTLQLAAISPFVWSGGSATLDATASSGLTIRTSVTLGPCSLSGTTLTATHAGSCIVAVDQDGSARYAAAAQVTRTVTVNKAPQAITFAALGGKLATDADFTVSATGGASGAAVTFSTASTACSVTGSTVSLITSGDCTITADQAGNADYLAAASAPRSFTVSLATQSISLGSLTPFSWSGGSSAVSASATSGLGVSYAVTGPCALSSGTLTATAAGTCTVTATQAGNARYAAATPVSGSVDISRAPQAITFGALAGKLASDAAFDLSASGGASGKPVTFSTASSSCSVTGSTVTLLRNGACAIVADQAGDANYDSAPSVTQSFTVGLGPQGITFPSVASFSWKDGSRSLGATSSSALPVAYSVVSGPCLLSGATLTATHAGTCTLAADQAGDERYSSATRVTLDVTVSKAPQAISFAALSAKLATDAPVLLSATGGASGGAVTFTTSSTACSVSGSTVTILGAGSCSIDADQAGDADYDAAPRATQAFAITLAPQSISFPAVASFVWAGGSASLAASATSSLAVSYTVLGGPCAVNDGAVSATGAGTCMVAADQAGNGRYAGAPRVIVEVVAQRAPQQISFAQPQPVLATHAPFALSASGGNSGNGLVFTSASAACSVSGSTVTILQAGTCVIAADQSGSADYTAAEEVVQSFAVDFAPQAISFPALASFVWRGGSAALAASANSGLGVSYSVVSGPCAVTGTALSATAAGSCVVAADQAGDLRYSAASRATVTVQVARASQALAFAALGNKLATDAAFTLSVTGGDSGNPVTYTTTSAACTLSGNKVTLAAVGACSISADQAGNANYDAAPRVTQAFTISLAPQTLAIAPVAPFSWKDGFAKLAATTNSGLPVTWTVVSGNCLVALDVLYAKSAGTCVVQAAQDGNAKYAAAKTTVEVQVTESLETVHAGGCGSTGGSGTVFEIALLAFAGLSLGKRARARRSPAE